MKNTDVEKKLTRKEQAVETRRKLFAKALEMFSKSDMDQVRVKDLCDEAGVSVGAFYNYYTSKEDLMLEAYRFFDEEIVTRAQAKTYESSLEAIYSIVSIQCGNHQGLFDLGEDCRTTEIMKNYAQGELLLWKQVLRILLRNGGDYALEKQRPMNEYVLTLVQKALMDGELVSGEPPEKITATILRISRGAIFDWAVRSGPYCMHKVAVSDVKHYLKAFKAE